MMGRTKQRTKKPFLGRQKKKGRIRKCLIGARGLPHSDEQVDSCEPEPRLDVLDQPERLDFLRLLENGESASAKKLKLFKDLVQSEDLNECGEEDCYLFVQLSAVIKLVSGLLCPSCLQPGVSLKASDVKHGLAS